MNTYQLIVILSFLTIWFSDSYAQDYKVKMGGNSKEWKVVVQLDKSGLQIEGYGGDEIIIQGEANTIPDRAKGLKPIYNTAVDNTGMGLEIKTEGSTTTIRKASGKADTDYRLKIPKNATLIVEELNFWGSGNFKVTNMESDIEITSKTSNIEIGNVSGSLVAHTTSGNIEVRFTQFSSSKPSSISSVAGEVDVALPSNAKANLRLKTITGEIFTDFEMDTPKEKGLEKVGGGKTSSTINGGGTELHLESISGNMYLRKK